MATYQKSILTLQTTLKQNSRAFGSELTAEFAKFLQNILLSLFVPESTIMTQSCLNLIQFFLVTVLVLPINFIAIHTVVFELCCKQQTNKHSEDSEARQVNTLQNFYKLYYSNWSTYRV